MIHSFLVLAIIFSIVLPEFRIVSRKARLLAMTLKSISRAPNCDEGLPVSNQSNCLTVAIICVTTGRLIRRSFVLSSFSLHFLVAFSREVVDFDRGGRHVDF